MDRKSIAKISASIGLISQIVLTIISFISRMIFLDIMGIEYLGLTSTLTQILGALALSEMGVQSVVIFRLYRPIIDNDVDEINQILFVFKTIYQYISIFILVGSIMLMPFLHFFLKGINIQYNIIYVVWILMSLSSVTSYLLSYNRALFVADQKEYRIKIIDLICYFVFTIIKLIVILITQNIYIYIVIDIICNIVSNAIVLFYRKKLYPWIRKTQPSEKLKKKLLADIKDLFSGKISAYVFNSTDNIVISSMIGTTYVGNVGNYTTITIAIKNILIAIVAPIQNIIGSYLVKKENGNVEGVFINYTFVMYILTLSLFLPTALLIDDFVSLFYGVEYRVDISFVICLIVSEYTSVIQIPAGAMADAAGLFFEQKKFLFVSAILNITLSLFGAYTIGITGVLIGTIIGNIFNWVMRAYLVYTKVINGNKKGLLGYFLRNVVYICVFVCIYLTLSIVYDYFIFELSFFSFILKGIIAEIVIMLTNILLFGRKSEFRYLKQLLCDSKEYTKNLST